MESDPDANVFALPARIGQQTLHGYVRAHVRQIEQALSFGVPYITITEAVHAAGFAGASVHTIEQAVYRARRYKLRLASSSGLRAVPAAPVTLPAGSTEAGRASMKKEMADFARRLRELARPPKPGERDP